MTFKEAERIFWKYNGLVFNEANGWICYCIDGIEEKKKTEE